MKLELEGQPLILQIAVVTCMIGFAASFLVAFVSQIVLMGRSGILGSRQEDGDLSWGERSARANIRFSKVFTEEEFRPLRRIWTSGWVGAIVSLGVLFLIMAIFGERT